MKKITYFLLAVVLILIGLTACKAKTINITIMSDGEQAQIVELPKGGTLADVTPPVKTGHKFIGWFTDSSFTSEFDTSTAIKKDIILYAKYQKNTYTLTFKAEGSEDIIRTVLYGAALTDIPSVPAKTGHTAVWDRTDFSNITSNLTINAIYTPEQMTLTFVIDGADDIVRTVPYGSTLTDIPTVPSIVGKTGAWDTVDFSNITQNKTIHAIYTDIRLTITFVSAFGEQRFEETREVLYGQDLTSIPQPKSFEGHTGVWQSAIYTNITSDFTVNAVYTPNQYSVRFYDPIDGMVFYTLNITYGTKISEAAAEIEDINIKTLILNPNNDDLAAENQSPNNVNFRFGNRSINADINSLITQNCDFYLIYDIKVFVTLYLQGGEFAQESPFTDGVAVEMLAGDTIAEPILNSRYGFRFEGWYSAPEQGLPVVFDEPLDSQGLVAYAVWTELFCDVSFPDIEGITFHYEGSAEHLKYGSTLSFTITSDVEILKIKANLLELIEQDGAYLLTNIEDDINIAVETAELSIHTLRFYNENDDELLFTRSVTHGQYLGKQPPLAQKPGAVGFWYYGDTQFDFLDAAITEDDMRFNARYFASNYTINYHIDGNIIINYVEYGNAEFEFYSPPRRENQLFDGWFFDAALTTRASKQAVAERGASVDLYPKWTDKKSISHDILGKWAGELILLEFLSDGSVRINDEAFFFECAFTATEEGIFILEQPLDYDDATLIFRNRTLTKTNNSYLFVDFDGAVVMVEGDTVEQSEETAGKYWYYDAESNIRFEFGATIKSQYVQNGYLRLFASDYRKITLYYDAMGGATVGSQQSNETQQYIFVSKDQSVFPAMFTAEKSGYTFVCWKLAGTHILVDIHYLNAFEVHSLKLEAVYAENGEYSGETIDGQYSAIRGDEIILVRFDADGSYQVMYFDITNMTMRRSIKQSYSYENGSFWDSQSRAITLSPNNISPNNITMILPNETQSISLNRHVLEYEYNRYVHETYGELLITAEGITLDGTIYSTVVQSGTKFYYLPIQNSIEVLTVIDLTDWTAEELSYQFPVEFRGTYEGVYPSEDGDFPFTITLYATYALWSLYDDPIVLTSILEDKYYMLEDIAMMFYFENDSYFLTHIEGAVPDIELTKKTADY